MECLYSKDMSGSLAVCVTEFPKGRFSCNKVCLGKRNKPASLEASEHKMSTIVTLCSTLINKIPVDLVLHPLLLDDPVDITLRKSGPFYRKTEDHSS